MHAQSITQPIPVYLYDVETLYGNQLKKWYALRIMVELVVLFIRCEYVSCLIGRLLGVICWYVDYVHYVYCV